MNDVATGAVQPAIALPQPTQLRWQPLRLGLVELYHYDVEEFWFRDGHLLLRGNNGTGKSKVLSLTLPFLLDANLSASRVEPDGDRTKRMEWNLLMGGLHERRVGYTWIEFGRCESTGTAQTLTLGCGLRAVAGRAHLDPWFFITEQRIGEDLWLTTQDRTALSRDRLIAALGERGEVFPTADAYRRAVDRRLFGLGTERYGALVNTLIQLRQPQLSKQPDDKRLSDALTESLSPLDQTALASVAEAMTELEDIRSSLDELEAMLKAVSAFGKRYLRYAQIAVRRRARSVRQAQTEYDQASRELNAATDESKAATTALEVCRGAERELSDQLAVTRARLEALHRDPRMIDAQMIEAAAVRAGDAQSQAEGAAKRCEKFRRDAERETGELTKRFRAGERTRTQLQAAQANATTLAKLCGVLVLPSQVLGEVASSDALTALESDVLDQFASRVREEEARRWEQIRAVRKRIDEVAIVEQALGLARHEQRLHEDTHDAAHESARLASAHLEQIREATHAAWCRYGSALRTLSLQDFDELLESLEQWTSTLDGVNPVKAALELAWQDHDARAAAQAERVTTKRRGLELEASDLCTERERLEGGELRSPPSPHTRQADTRVDRTGAPLWQLVDFAPNVGERERAQLEAALEAAGIMDAWVLPDGVILNAHTEDVLLTKRRPHAQSLGEWLVPTIPSKGLPSSVTPETVASLLSSIACAERDTGDAEVWVSPAGSFRVGVLQGSWEKSTAQYIGHSAREAARRARLAEVAARLEEIRVALVMCDEESAAIEAARQAARLDYREAPPDEPLHQTHAHLGAHERIRAEAQTRLGEVQSRLIEARNAVDRARDALGLDARDLALPATADELAALEDQLREFRATVSDFVGAIGDHQAALAELRAQEQRELNARTDFGAAAVDLDEKERVLLVASETLKTLRSTVGKEVDELLGTIAEAEDERRRCEDKGPGARTRTDNAVSIESAARQKCVHLDRMLQERGAMRRRVMDELQVFAADTGFLAVATPEIALPEGDAAWGVEAALSIARRAEQALSDVRAEDSDWQRIQHDISGDLTELQTSMSAQNSSATAESSQGCLIVRILYQQRPMRPDALEQALSTELNEQKLILSVREREILEEHLEKEIAANLQRMINETETLVTSMNAELEARPTSTGVRFRLEWTPLPEDDEDGIVGLAEARRRLLKTSADAWSDEDRRQLGAFLHARIETERQREEHGTVLESLSRALDYRRWHRFTVKRRHYGSWLPLSGPASSGERALGLTVPLFAAASSHYESAGAHAPRLVLLDEAFAGIDDEARASCMGLIAKFGLDFVMTSEREWGCYAELPGLAICQIVRREGMDAVHVTRWSWNGRERTRQEDPTRRFPDDP